MNQSESSKDLGMGSAGLPGRVNLINVFNEEALTVVGMTVGGLAMMFLIRDPGSVVIGGIGAGLAARWALSNW